MNKIYGLVENMLCYKESLGYSRRTYKGPLLDLASYLSSQNIDKITLENILPWCQKRDTETASGFRTRLTSCREFTKYLHAVGEIDRVLPTSIYPKVASYTPYIFTDDELKALLLACNSPKHIDKSSFECLVIPTIYRLIFYCGLRPNEGRELKRNDINLDQGTLLIRKNKTHKERLIPMANDVCEFCKEYSIHRDTIFSKSEYFFPNSQGDVHSSKWLQRNFLKLWEQTGYSNPNKRVRVYDLRHRFATTVLTKWIENGEDIYSALPYLREYMGHEDLEGTAYYIHLLPERLVKTTHIDWSRFESIIPEV